ncbi:ribosome maturation protein [Mycena floridula]|nr:ribosome maturation protein [Mycena floridula]
MTKSLTKVIYKPDSQSTEEYTIIVNPEEYKKWKDGDTTIPIAEVVDSFAVFVSSQGSQGILGAPSKQQLDTTFGTHNDVAVAEKMLQLGKAQSGDGITSSGGTSNVTRGSNVVDRGTSRTGI